MTDEPTPQSFSDELDQVVARHNELFQSVPGYAVAMLVQEAGYRAGQHGVEIDLIESTDDAFVFEVGSCAAVLAPTEDPSVLDELETDVAMLDHGGMLPSPGGGGP